MSDETNASDSAETERVIVNCKEVSLTEEEQLECLASFVPPADAPDYSQRSRIIGIILTALIVVSFIVVLIVVYKKRWREDHEESVGKTKVKSGKSSGSKV